MVLMSCDSICSMCGDWRGLEQSLTDDAADQWRTRLRASVRASGGHFEHTLRLSHKVCSKSPPLAILNIPYVYVQRHPIHTDWMSVWQTSNLRGLRLGEEKKKIEEDRKKKPQGKNIMACPIP